MKTLAIPINTEVMDIEVEKVIKRFDEAVQKKKLDGAAIIIEEFLLMFRVKEGEIKLYKLGETEYIEIKAGDCTISSNAGKEFVLTRRGGAATVAPRLVIEGDTYSVDSFAAFVKRGFKALLSAAIADL